MAWGGIGVAHSPATQSGQPAWGGINCGSLLSTGTVIVDTFIPIHEKQFYKGFGMDSTIYVCSITVFLFIFLVPVCYTFCL